MQQGKNERQPVQTHNWEQAQQKIEAAPACGLVALCPGSKPRCQRREMELEHEKMDPLCSPLKQGPGATHRGTVPRHAISGPTYRRGERTRFIFSSRKLLISDPKRKEKNTVGEFRILAWPTPGFAHSHCMKLISRKSKFGNCAALTPRIPLNPLL